MSMIFAEASDTQVPVGALVNKNGPVTGLTVECSVYDVVNDTWLDFVDNVFRASPGTQTKACPEKGTSGFYRTTVNTSNAASTHLVVRYEITAGGTGGAGEDILVLAAEVYDIANATDQSAILLDTGTDLPVQIAAVETHGDATWATADVSALATSAALATVDGNVDLVLEDTGTTIPATLATLSTQTSQDTIDANVDLILEDTGTTLPGQISAMETHGDSTWATATGFAVAGDAMDLVADAVDGTSLATAAVLEIRNSILSDGTPFAGASIADILADTDTVIPGMLADMQGVGFLTAQHSLKAIMERGDIAWLTGAGSSATATAEAVWDAVASLYDDAGSMGELLHGAGGAFSPAQVAAAVWTEVLTPHLGADQAAQYLADILADTGDMEPRIPLIQADVDNTNTVVGINLDATVGSRAVPGDSMVASSIATNAVDADALAADAVAEIAAQVLADIASAHGAGSYQTATGFAIPGSAMTLTTGEKVAIVDDIWNEAQAGHGVAGSFGLYLDSMISTAGGGATPEAVADAVWDELQSEHLDAGSFGSYLDAKVSVAGGSGLDAQGVRDAIGMAAADMDTQLGDIDTVVDAISVQTTAGSDGPWTTAVATTIDQQDVRDAMLLPATGGVDPIDTKLNDLETQVATRSATGDAMTLTAPAEAQLVDAVWDEDGADHLQAGTEGFLQDQAATGGAGVTPLQIEQAVWGALQASYQDTGTMGKAVSDGASLPADLVSALNRYFQTLRKYGPVLVKQPLAGKDEVHTGDTGILLTVIVILDGAYSDLSQATSITFNIQAPDSDVVIPKVGAGVTTPTGSYTTLTTDSDVFGATGRWRVQVEVVWPDTSTKLSDVYHVDVQAPLAYT